MSNENEAEAKPRARELTPQQIREAKDSFDLFDTTGTGVIDQKDLKIALMTLGFETTKDEIRHLVADLDSNNTTTLDFNDFLHIIKSELPKRDPRKELEEAFKLFDVDQTGRITFKNLKSVVSSMGESLTDQEIMEIIDEADKTGDHDITLDEFIDLIQDNAIF